MPSRKSILLVDDQPENLQLIGAILQPNYQVMTAAGGAEALRLLQQESLPDLILLDVMMPEMDGYDLCRRVRFMPHSKRIPVIFLTALTDAASEARGFAAGAVDFVTKPINPPVLFARIAAQIALAEQIRHAQLERDLSAQMVEKVSRERDVNSDLARRLLLEVRERERVEAALRQSQARFTRVTQKLKNRMLFFSHDRTGHLVYLSDDTAILGARQPGELLGRQWSEIVDWLPGDIERGEQESRRVFAGEKASSEAEMSFRHREGGIRHLLVHGYRVHDRELDEDLIEGTAIDITARKAREIRLQVLHQAVEQASVSVMITDRAGDLLYVNPHFSAMTGFAYEEAVGQNPRILKSDEHPKEVYRELWETIISGRVWRGELVNRKKTGELLWVSVAISPIRDDRGDIVHFVGVSEDIGDRKELERIREDVERIMRHDLKNPLSFLIALPELLLMEGNLTPDQQESVSLMRETGQKMNDMINLSLDLFKMETGCYEYKASAVALTPLLKNLLRIFASRLETKDLRVSLSLNGAAVDDSTPILVTADDKLLYSMLVNLFVNAIEASPAGATIDIEIATAARVALRLCNRGAVPAALRAHFFDKYRTLGKQGGTGLGTYSAKLMANTMGFNLEMQTSDAENRTCILLGMPAPQ
jgi:PAS domain S-box-containing protein